MKRLFFLAILPLLLSAGEQGEISVVEEALHRYPDAPKQSERIIGGHEIRGVVIAKKKEDFLSGRELQGVEGLKVVDLTIPGGEYYLNKELKTIYEGEVLSMGLVDEIKRAVAEYFRDHGYPLVIVEAPDQEVSGGVLQLVVLESCLGKISVEGNEHFSTESLKKYIKLKPGENIDEKVLVRNLNFINRNPFRHANMMYLPGEEVGTTDILLKVKDRRTTRVYGGIENTGVQTTGRNRLFAGLTLGNVFRRSDVFGYQYTTSGDFHKFQAHTMQYTSGLPWGHIVNIYGGYSSVNAELDKFEEGVLRADGSTEIKIRTIKGDGFSGQASVRYLIPFLLNRYLLHDIIIGFDWKRMNNRTIFGSAIPVAGDNATLTQFVLGYAGDYERSTFRIDFETNLFYSPGTWLPDQTNKDYRSLTPKAKKNYVYWHGAAIYLQKLPWDFSIRLRGELQASSQNLLPSEEFGLGGYNTVRGYEERVVNKENVILLSGELRSPPLPVVSKRNKKVTDALQILIFCDYATGRNKFSFFENATSDILPKQTEWLIGIGPGLRYTWDPYLTARLDWGLKLHKNEIIGEETRVVHFAVTASY